MLTAAIDGLVTRFGLEGERLGEVVAGAVLKHSRDFNLARESVLGSRLSPETPATDIQQACGTGLQAADPGRQQDRARPDRRRHRRWHRHHLRRAGRDQREAAQEADEGQRRPRHQEPAGRPGRHPPGDIGLSIPQNGEPRTGLSMGDHAALTALEWQVDPRGPGRAGRHLAPAPRRGLRRAASSTTRSRRSAASSATPTCAPTPPPRSSPSSSRSSARARPPR